MIQKVNTMRPYWRTHTGTVPVTALRVRSKKIAGKRLPILSADRPTRPHTIERCARLAMHLPCSQLVRASPHQSHPPSQSLLGSLRSRMGSPAPTSRV
jgi:hypothetical protein